MKLNMTWSVWSVALFAGMLAASPGSAQTPAARTAEAAIEQGAKDNKSVYVVFYRDWDANAETVSTAVKAHVGAHVAQATWIPVRITDAAERAAVEKYQVGRAPMPLVLVLHPNGAVAGAFVKTVGPAELAASLLSPKKAACTKLLQQNQLVLLCVQASPDQPVAQGVLDFQADPLFARRAAVVTVLRNDPAEADFLNQLKVAPQTATVFMAPPGVMVGSFAATATKNDLATALHAAGKCCNDANCKHNHR